MAQCQYIKKSTFRRVANRILHMLSRFLPGSMTVRPFLHRLRGVNIYGKIFIGDDVYIENEYPECVEIHDGAEICLRTTIIAHIRGPGKIVIGKKVFIGANCVITASPGRTLTIGEGSVLTASTTVTTSVPPYTLWGGEKSKPIAKVTVPFTPEVSYDTFVRALLPLKAKDDTKQ